MLLQRGYERGNDMDYFEYISGVVIAQGKMVLEPDIEEEQNESV